MSTEFKSRLKAVNPLFIATVVIPTFIAVIYFGLIASDVYISESRFVIRSPEKQVSSALDSLFRSAGSSMAGDEIFAVQSYIESRDALKSLNRNNAVASAYSRPSVDAFSRFGGFAGDTTFESLYKYYRKRVTIDHESSSTISTMLVRAYTPKDAYTINEKLLQQAEALVNHLNNRSREDLIRFATTEAASAEKQAQKAAIALAALRNTQGVIDPERQATIQMQLISKLQDELISTKTQLLQLRAFTPANPQIPVLNTRIAGLTKEIDGEISKIAGGSKSLADSAVQFQRATLENEFATKQLGSALASLEQARNEARRKQVYLERIVQPNIPDKSLEPRRWRGILSTLALGLVVWAVMTMLLAGVREHRD
jgi:capsular polysaccharide transport system permease protein